MSHSFFSPSSAHRWIACPGSMAFAENQTEGDSSTFADDGTASHEWAALCLQYNKDAELFLGSVKSINGATYDMDEARASFIQQYLDDVRRRALGGSLYVEHHIDLSHILGADQGGTGDAIIYNNRELIVEDLKYGTGEKVNAKDNPQLMLYLLGALADMDLLGNPVEKFTGVICQPRLGHIDEASWTYGELMTFAGKAAFASEKAETLVRLANGGAAYGDEYAGLLEASLHPGEKQCRWCRAKAKCPALAEFVTNEVRCDFETMEAGAVPTVSPNATDIARSYAAVPLIEDWCRAVRGELSKLVAEGVKVPGPDGLPYKFVEGEEGRRQWTDETAAEAALLGQLAPDKAYAPRKLITAPQAAKLLDKKKTAKLWEDIFKPLIKRSRGQPILTVGSDPRTPVSGVASAQEFEMDLSA